MERARIGGIVLFKHSREYYKEKSKLEFVYHYLISSLF